MLIIDDFLSLTSNPGSELAGSELKPSHRPFKQAFNNLLQIKQLLSFDELSPEQDQTLLSLEQALADELLEYHAEREIFIIVHAVDEDHYDEAWFLSFKDEVEDLDKSIKA